MGVIYDPFSGRLITTSSENMFIEDSFYLDGSGDVTDLVIFTRDVPFNCYAVRVSAVVSEARTAGSIRFQLRRNGSLVASTDLDLYLDGTNTTRGEVEIPSGNALFFYNDSDSISLSASSVGFTPNTCSVDVYVTVTKS